MKRLNRRELDARIHSFMERKLAEFPDLDEGAETPMAPVRTDSTAFRATNRFVLPSWHATRTA